MFGHFASAAPLSVAVSPTRIDIEAPPGAHLTQAIKFWNGTEGGLAIHVAGGDVAQQDEEGHAAVAEEDPANSLRDWVHPEYPDLTVFPKQEITLNFSVDVPPNADPGSHWGALLVTTAQQSSGGGAAVQARSGTIILVRVLGDAKEKLRLESFSAPRFLQAPPVALQARFRNEGSVHEATHGFIEVRDMFGWLAATGTLPERNVLPGTVRKIPLEVSGGIWFGRYTATLRATYGAEGTALPEATVRFWIVPWKRYGVHVLVVFAVLALAIWKRRNFQRSWYVLRTGKLPPANY